MAVGSELRRQKRKPQIAARFALGQVEAVLDLLHLADMAWHDCYGPQELEVPQIVLDLLRSERYPEVVARHR